MEKRNYEFTGGGQAMRQVNGVGSKVSLAAIAVACLCAECIPILIISTLVAAGGVALDFIRGDVSGCKRIKKRPARRQPQQSGMRK